MNYEICEGCGITNHGIVVLCILWMNVEKWIIQDSRPSNRDSKQEDSFTSQEWNNLHLGYNI